MEESVPFGSRTYFLLLLVLLACRGMDFLSTWVATPNMVLEGNPIAKKLGWRWGTPINLLLCILFAAWPLPAIVISTTSVLVAARNFQAAWLMRSMGEQQYREWHVARIQETSATLYLACLFGQAALFGALGFAVIYFTFWEKQTALLAIGLGIVAYAIAVVIYSLIGVCRLRRSYLQVQRVTPTLQPQEVQEVYPRQEARPEA
jgi:hypothetical protein